jgi:hypothetical protein
LVYEVRTDRDGSTVKFGPSYEGNLEGLTLSWQREGGLAGFCDEMVIFTSGEGSISSCRENEERRSFRLDETQMTQMQAWIERYGLVMVVDGEPVTADGMEIRFTLNGSGSDTPDDAVEAEMLEFAQTIYTRFSE